MNQIILATSNEHKVHEIRKILKLKNIRVLSFADFSEKIDINENARTFEGNAAKKAKAAAKAFNMTAIADDSGLCVDSLRGAPGVRSARYVKPPVTARRLCKKLLKAMEDVPDDKRGAIFVCCVAIAQPSGRTRTIRGVCRGRIIREMKGSQGFGYDPVFVPEGFSRTFAQMPARKKNSLSHRGRAFLKAKATIETMMKCR